MKRDVTTKEYQAYKAKTNGCLTVTKIHYQLYSKDNQELLLTGDITPGEEAKQYVLGTHPSRDLYDSVIGASLDIEDKKIKEALLNNMTKREREDLKGVPLPDTSARGDEEQGRRAKAIVWGVYAIDDESNEVWVRGII